MNENLIELDENDEVIENKEIVKESLDEFRMWGKSHPFIKGLNFEKDEYCLAFLRARKFSLKNTKELFNRCVIFLKEHQELFDYSGDNLTKLMELYETGHILVLHERNEKGQRVILCRTSTVDTKKFTIDDVMRLFTLVSLVILSQTDTQKFGTIFINDLSGVNASHLRLLPYKIVTNMGSYMNVSALRVKGIYIVGLPSFAVHIFKAIRLVLNEKLRKRLFVMSDIKELWQHVNQSIMPKEYGGSNLSFCELLEEFKKLILDKRESLMADYENIEVDYEKYLKFNKK